MLDKLPKSFFGVRSFSLAISVGDLYSSSSNEVRRLRVRRKMSSRLLGSAIVDWT